MLELSHVAHTRTRARRVRLRHGVVHVDLRPQIDAGKGPFDARAALGVREVIDITYSRPGVSLFRDSSPARR